MEGARVGGAKDGGCWRGQGLRVWEGPGMEGVGGARDGVGGVRDGGCGRGQGWCGRGQEWSVWEGIASLYKTIIIFLGGIPVFHNLYINP